MSSGTVPAIWRRLLGRARRVPRPKKPEDLKRWQATGGRKSRSITMPLSKLLAAQIHEQKASIQKLKAEHVRERARLEKVSAEVLVAVGDLSAHVVPDLRDALRDHGLAPAVIDEIAVVVEPVVKERVDRVTQRRNDGDVGGGMEMMVFAAAYHAAKIARPTLHEKAEKLWEHRGKPDEPEYRDADREISAWRKVLRDDIRDRMLKRIVAVLGHTPNPDAALAKITRVTDEDVRASWVESRLTDRGRTVDASKSHAYDLDADPGKLKLLLGVISPTVVPTAHVEVHPDMGRAHCTVTNAVRIERPGVESTLWHEFGHAIEHASKGITAAANALRDRRAGKDGRPKVRLADKPGGAGAYEAHEVSYEDAWWSPYVGKWYGRNGSTEVLSMGVQEFMHDPVAFLVTDPEHFAFTAAALSGRLGTADRDTHTESLAHLREEMKKKP